MNPKSESPKSESSPKSEIRNRVSAALNKCGGILT